MTKTLAAVECNDAELVAQSLAGDRDAFGQIVTRYQSLVCSLAYSAIGRLGQSEDIAQETFITAWKHLAQLRERGKLRAWLCGIARNRINNCLRREGREPAHLAEPLDLAPEAESPEKLPVEQAINREEEAIMWRSLERIPAIYREPLILFYREQRSIARVAESLELSEEAVKQRLSRGRKLLQEQVAAFVEGALRQSTPGRAFTALVVAALPASVAKATAATVATAAVQGVATAKATTGFGLFGGFLSPLLGPVGGLIGMKGFIESSRSPRERIFSTRWAATLMILAVGFALGIIVLGPGQSLRSGAKSDASMTPLWSFVGVYAVAVASAATWAARRRKQIQIEEGTFDELGATLPFYDTDSRGFKWNVYGALLGAVFSGPPGWLMLAAARAGDRATLMAVTVAAFALFWFGAQAILRRADRALPVMVGVAGISWGLLLATLQLRWQAWTGASPWRRNGGAFSYLTIGTLIFLLLLAAWLVKRRAPSSTTRRADR